MLHSFKVHFSPLFYRSSWCASALNASVRKPYLLLESERRRRLLKCERAQRATFPTTTASLRPSVPRPLAAFPHRFGVECAEVDGERRERASQRGWEQRTGLGEIILLLFVVLCNERLRLGQFLLLICQLTLPYSNSEKSTTN